MSENKKIRWGIFSTGGIAGTFARGLRESETGELLAVASRTQDSANTFAEKNDVPRAYASYDAMLADPEIDAVYIATPHPLHAEWAIKSADAGKHILCEKALTLNWPDAQRIVEAAERNGVQLLEAFMYRCHPQTAKIVELVKSGVLGEIKHIESTFAFNTGADEDSRWLNLELGGGGILDVGCYTVSLVRMIAGAAQNRDFAEPIEVKATGKLGSTGCDDYATALLTFAGGLTATCLTGVRLNADGHCKIYGSKGNLTVPSPWFCSATPNLILEQSSEKQEITVESPKNLYAYEADSLAALIRGEKLPIPAQTALDALGNMRTLDLWRKQIGLVYPHETPARLVQPVAEEPLKVYPNKMRYAELPLVLNSKNELKAVSKIVMGTMLEGSIDPLTHGLALFDDFYERGGTAFDTAHVYGGGAGEKVVGHWLKTRGVRDEVTILVKGAHPPHCTIEGFQRELDISLDRLQIDGGDIYMLHRDNLEIPVSEWVDAMNEAVQQGKFKIFGGSNWSIERLDEANAYAESKGVQGFTAVSNNFSLARMVNPVWAGCISSSDPESKAWFEQTQTALFSWSSQARGFFARADRDFVSDSELVRTWYSDDNFERLERAKKLADEKGVSPVVIAAAYVLSQKFPIYALIGPRSLAETRDSMHAFEVELSESEVKWLNLE